MKKILMLSANPKNTNPLRLGEEARKIQEALKLAKQRDEFEIATCWAVRVEDLRRAMIDYQPKDRLDYESPQHNVTVQRFFMGKFTITQQQYQAVMGENPSYFKGEKRPVEQVSWDQAIAFCAKLSQRTGKTYRLPSEAEWEYACRGWTTTPFYFGETITTDLANYNGDFTYASEPKGVFRKQTTEVGKFPPNACGLYDMHGNIWEWCQDTWHDNYQGAPVDGTAWVSDDKNNTLRLLRGGWWVILPRYCRSAYRFRIARDGRFFNVGFRVVVIGAARIL